MKSENLGYAYSIIATIILSVMFILNAIVLRETTPLSAAATVLFFNLVIVAIYTLIFNKIQFTMGTISKHWKVLVTLGVINGGIVILFFKSLDILGVTNLAFIARFSIIFIVIIAFISFKERLTKIEFFGIFVAIVGGFMMTNSPSISVLGIVFGISFSLLLAIKESITKSYSMKVNPIILNNIKILFSTITVIIFVFSTSTYSIPPVNTLVLLLVVSIFAGLIGNVLVLESYKLAKLSKVTIVRSMDIFLILVLSFFLFSEMPTTLQLIGGLLMTFGSFLILFSRNIKIGKKNLIPSFNFMGYRFCMR